MKKNITKQPICILGGMGPQASAKLLEILINLSAKEYGAQNDEDFPEIILNSIPVPDFISNRKNTDIVLKALIKRVKKLETFNPLCFGIACNTAHVILGDLQKATSIPFLSIISEVSIEVSNAGIEKVGLLGTPVTLSSKIYQNALSKKGICTIVPPDKDQQIIEKVIRRVLAGKADNKDRKMLELIAISLQKKGAQGIILGCTELPLIFPKNFNMPIFDSIEIMAQAFCKKYFNNTKELN